MVYWNVKESPAPGDMLHSPKKFISTSFLRWWEDYQKLE